MHYFSLLGCVFFFSGSIFSQTPFEIEKRDYVWVFGDQNEGGTTLNFNFSSLVSDFLTIPIDLDITNASICDKEGDLLAFTNGLSIVDNLGEVILNGDGLNPGGFADVFPDFYILNQGTLFLPKPSSDSIYYLFHGIRELPDVSVGGSYVSKFNYSTILISASNEESILLEKNIPVIQDTLTIGEITSSRHANGRDWWFLIPKHSSNEYYRILFTPLGLSYFSNQVIGDTVISGLSQTVFSPDGTKYVRFNAISEEIGQFVDIYNFDRCSGLLSDHITISYDSIAYAGGVAISPNSRFLYVSSKFFIDQYDLEADNIEASRITIAQFDGFANPFPNNFFLAQLAPDDRIYINSSNSTEYLHRIEEPNRYGTDANVQQHSVLLAAENKFSLSNNPYYALGPLDGSPCDTLGLDNHPVAYFRHTTEALMVTFTDYSKLAPLEWIWDFGDGTSSELVDPIHVYQTPGTYEVCLTVKNQNAVDTYCDSVSVTLTNIQDLNTSRKISIYPNPTKDFLSVATEKGFPLESEIVIYNLLGQKELQQKVQDGQIRQIVDVSHLPKGTYIIQLVVDGKMIGSEKVLKQ